MSSAMLGVAYKTARRRVISPGPAEEIAAPMQDVPYGHCHCGCGAKTRAAPKTMRSRGWVKGRPVRYIHGHHAQKYQTVDERYVVRESGYTTACWVWTAGKTGSGYGALPVRCEDGWRVVPAHRYVYERDRGPISGGLTLDHLCRNRACVNPDHLEPVTQAVNVRRGLRTPYGRERRSGDPCGQSERRVGSSAR